MKAKVGAIRGGDKLEALRDLIDLTGFDGVLERERSRSGKAKREFRIAIKPNIMVFINRDPAKYLPTVTDKDLVESLIDHLSGQGYRRIHVVESRTDVSAMLKNRTVPFVAARVGYLPTGRYQLADLSEQWEVFRYEYVDDKGRTKTWKDRVGTAWREADFRITFAKCKTHEHDWMTLGVKNVYGCFPRAEKIARYHIREEIFDITARSIRNFPVHFSFIDAWTASDGYQGYKIAHEQKLEMLFGGPDVVAVDMEVFDRAGLDARKSRFLGATVEQAYGGRWPAYEVAGDRQTKFQQICDWQNVDDKIVESTDYLEEVYVMWAIVNLKPSAELADYELFPPKNFFVRVMAWFIKKLYGVFKLFKWYRRLYRRRKGRKPPETVVTG